MGATGDLHSELGLHLLTLAFYTTRMMPAVKLQHKKNILGSENPVRTEAILVPNFL